MLEKHYKQTVICLQDPYGSYLDMLGVLVAFVRIFGWSGVVFGVSERLGMSIGNKGRNSSTETKNPQSLQLSTGHGHNTLQMGIHAFVLGGQVRCRKVSVPRPRMPLTTSNHPTLPHRNQASNQATNQPTYRPSGHLSN